MTDEPKMREISVEELRQKAIEAREKNPEAFKKFDERYAEIDRKTEEILTNLHKNKEQAYTLLESMNSQWGGDDKIYRFYHESFKTYDIQMYTKEVVTYMLSLLDGFEYHDINPKFLQILREGTYKEFTTDANTRWLYEARPMVEAYFHAKYFLEMLIKYGIEKTKQERDGQTGWASVLYFYNIR